MVLQPESGLFARGETDRQAKSSNRHFDIHGDQGLILKNKDNFSCRLSQIPSLHPLHLITLGTSIFAAINYYNLGYFWQTCANWISRRNV